jgi:hypothetical protein
MHRLHLLLVVPILALGLTIVAPTATATATTPAPTTTVGFPSKGATLSGSTYLDASASNATSVEVRLFGGSYGYDAPVVCTGTKTDYGWVCSWNTTTVPKGTYRRVSEALNSAGHGFSTADVKITVDNATTTSGTCSDPVNTQTDGTYNTDGGIENWWVSADAWSGDAAPVTVATCSQSSWNATTTQANYSGAVESYPDTEYDVGGRAASTNGGDPTIAAYAGGSITSTFSEKDPPAGSWDAGYDLWLNDWGTGTSGDIMIWNQWSGAQSYWPEQATTAVTLGGVGYKFYDNGGELMFFRDTQVTSGSANILAAFQWLVAHGYESASSVPTQLEYGTEIASTVGAETFETDGLTFILTR